MFEALTVFENLEIAQKNPKSVWACLRARLSGEQRDRIEQMLQTLRLTSQRHRPAGLLSHGQKQFLKSACCWCRSRICCCWMSRRPA